MPQPSSSERVNVPPLEAGDRLTRSEFERRYAARPDIRRAELIEGIVYLSSPTRFRHHGRPHAKMMAWLCHYTVRAPGIELCDNTTVRMDLDNEPQPDASLSLPPEAGGNCHVDRDDYLAGAPELIVEVASSSASYDLGSKKNAYRRNGVQEYVAWRVLDDAIDWFSLQDGTYERLSQAADGIVRSAVFPGLWLDPVALLADRMDRVIEVVEQGLTAPEHRAFRLRLDASRRS